MKTTTVPALILGIVLLSAGCGQSKDRSERDASMSAPPSTSTQQSAPDANAAPPATATSEEMGGSGGPAMADSASATGLSSSAAVAQRKDSTQQFIRTADIKFQVKSVIKSTNVIEDITNKYGGFVTYTNLTSTIDNKTTAAISADSSLVSTYYTVVNSMILRVPNTALDTTLKDISVLVDYLDHRIIRADNVALNILSNEMTRQRLTKHQEQLRSAIDRRAKTLDETTTAEQNLLNNQQSSDESIISNLSIKDQIRYSTINLNIYQRQAVWKVVIPNDKNIDEYTPGVGSRIADALYFGWRTLESVVVFLMQFWAFYVVLLAGWIAYRRFGKR